MDPRTRLTPGAVAVALVLVAGTGVVTAVRRGTDGTRGAPETFAAVVDGHVVVLPSDDPTLPPEGIGPDFFHPDYRSTAVAAAGDGRTYFTGGSRKDGSCAGIVERVEVDEGGTGHTTVADGVDGRVIDLAVSPDGARLAYVAYVAYESLCAWPELHVLDLRTGTDRVWAHPGTDGPPDLASPAWAPDSRHLAFQAGAEDIGDGSLRLLDTAAPPGDFLDVRALAPSYVFTKREYCLLMNPAFRGGDLLAMHACRPLPMDSANTVTAHVVTVDQHTGELGRTLFALRGGIGNQVAFDRSGRHALVVTRDRAAPPVLTRWDGGRSDRVVDTGGLPVTAAAW